MQHVTHTGIMLMPDGGVADCYHDGLTGDDFSVYAAADQTIESQLARMRAEWEKHRPTREARAKLRDDLEGWAAQQ